VPGGLPPGYEYWPPRHRSWWPTIGIVVLALILVWAYFLPHDGRYSESVVRQCLEQAEDGGITDGELDAYVRQCLEES
jgi:hypothetical protein